jgi:DNA-binding Lrp family transcriptional regulator
MDLDELDIKILSQIKGNCKLTYKQLAKKTGLNINTIASRIKRLENNKYILGYRTFIDYSRIGYRSCAIVRMILESPENLNRTDLMGILSIPEVVIVVGSTGNYDLNVLVRTKNFDSLLDIIGEIGKNRHVVKMDTEFMVKDYKTYEQFNPFVKNNPEKDIWIQRRKPIDELDLAILREIRCNANISLRELSQIVKSPISTIKERMDRLEVCGIIKGYVTDINFSKLGYWGFGSIRIKLKADHITDSSIVENILQIPELVTLYRSMGDYELIAGFLLRSSEQSLEIIKQVANIKGVLKTETGVALALLKTNMQYNPLRKN